MQAFLALGNEGIGKEHARYQIVSVTNTQDRPLFMDGAVYMMNYQIQTLGEYVDYRISRMKRTGRQNRLVFHTPISLKYQGKFLDEYHIEAIWYAVLRRIYMLECFEEITDNGYTMERLKTLELPDIVKQEAHHVGVPRYSSTQNKQMVLNGIKGYIQLSQVSEQILPWLLAGELIHIGKNTSFGFGRYSVEIGEARSGH